MPTFRNIAQRWRAFTHYRFERPDAAAQAEHAITVAEVTDNAWDVAAARWMLGLVRLREGDSSAIDQLRSSLDRSVEPGYPFSRRRRRVPGDYDLVCFFDCLHDMGDPVGIARHTSEQLTPGRTSMLVEPFAHDDKAVNHTLPTAKILYGASAVLCTPNSLSQPVGRAMGTQAGEPGTAAIFEEAGYSHFRRIAETPFDIIYEARV